MKASKLVGGRACRKHERCCQSGAVRRPRQVEAMELNGALTDHAAWWRLTSDLCEPGKLFALEGQQGYDIPIFQLGCLPGHAIGGAKVRVEILWAVVGSEGFCERARGKFG